LFGRSLAQLSLPAGAAAALRTGQVPKPNGAAPLPAGLMPSLTELAPLYGVSTLGAAAAAGSGTFAAPRLQQLLAVASQSGLPGTALPDQQVGADGGISIPYAGRIAVAGKTPQQAAAIIERRLAPLAIDPQALVVVTLSAANSVAVTGGAIAGRRVKLSPGGDRVLQVIAAAGGARAPVRDTYVQLTRGGVTAGVPLATLITDPAEDIFAEPGDVLTVERRPQTFSVFGATGRNAAITFTRDRLSLAEALGEAGGLLDDRADARAVFVFRYEPAALVRALREPLAGDAPDGMSPVAYRLDLKKANSLLLARRFPVRDKDVIFVADAPTQPLYYFFQTLQQVTGPVVTGFLTCQSTHC
jgi:polysaccharide biosynthesis/export protein